MSSHVKSYQILSGKHDQKSFSGVTVSEIQTICLILLSTFVFFSNDFLVLTYSVKTFELISQIQLRIPWFHVTLEVSFFLLTGQLELLLNRNFYIVGMKQNGII